MDESGGRRRPLFVLSGLIVGLAAGMLAMRRLDVVEVTGRSMAPTLAPGDWLVVESLTYARRLPQVGEIVLTRDPRQRSRELIKRVHVRDGSWLELRGDAPQESTDSRAFGPVAGAGIRWRAVARCWPRRRVRWFGREPGSPG